MNAHRTGEQGSIPQRSDRFYTKRKSWFFNTREGSAIGPFRNRSQAERGLSDFIEFVRLAEPYTLSKLCTSLVQ